ncbi:MAG: DUF1697 domain-containing protein [Oceanicaulis sp.]|nr:DUF1697 domain-containing protein [Oceanicaulis sp.]
MSSNSNWIALLRGVNVGGGNKTPMAELRKLCAGLGWRDVKSYIASGNLVFSANNTANDLSSSLRAAMAEQMGVDVPVLVLPATAVSKVLKDCPFNPEKGNLCHVFFLWNEPVVDWDAYAAHRMPGEELKVDGRRAWLHTPEGFGQSKLAEKLPKVITGTEMTGRNLNTIRKLVEMSA